MVSLGAIFGSFGGVLVSRFFSGQSVVSPGSHCDYCSHQLRWFENLPVISFLIQQGRCRNCKHPIDVMQLHCEIITAILFMGISFLDVYTVEKIVLLVIAVASYPLALIDYRSFQLPDRIVLPLITFTGLAFLWTIVYVAWSQDSLVSLSVIIPALIPFLYLLIFIFSRGYFGLGDVKLSVVLSLGAGFVDWQRAISSNIIAFYVAGSYATYLILKGNRGKVIAFGPYMLLGFWLAILTPLSFSSWILRFWTID